MKTEVFWTGKVPTKCDTCTLPVRSKFVDGVLRKQRQWAIMCTECHAYFGLGIGTGRGQRYERQWDGRFLKVDG